MDSDLSKKEEFKKLLAETIGVEVGDIKEEDFFTEDLHMNAIELADFIHLLEEKGFAVSGLDLGEIETVGDMIESLNIHEEI
jgi:acyl carrier protein